MAKVLKPFIAGRRAFRPGDEIDDELAAEVVRRVGFVEGFPEGSPSPAPETPAPAPPSTSDGDGGPVPPNVKDVLSWVGDDLERAAEALEVERGRDGGPRSSLEPKLIAMIEEG